MADAKQYSLDADNRGDYIRFTVGGLKVTPQIALDYWREIIDECDRSHCSKILLEHNFAEMIGMQEMLTIIGPIAEMLKGRIMAFYDSYGHYEVPEAGKVILRSHDIKMKMFDDLNEAERWLRAN